MLEEQNGGGSPPPPTTPTSSSRSSSSGVDSGSGGGGGGGGASSGGVRAHHHQPRKANHGESSAGSHTGQPAHHESTPLHPSVAYQPAEFAQPRRAHPSDALKHHRDRFVVYTSHPAAVTGVGLATRSRYGTARLTHRESLAHAIDRMLKHYSAQRVEGQIRRWHPGLSRAQAMRLVEHQEGRHQHGGDGFLRFLGREYHAVGREYHHLEHRVVSLERGFVHFVERTARSEYRADLRDLEEAVKLGKLAGREIYKHSDDIALGLAIAGLIAGGVLAPEAVLPMLLFGGSDLLTGVGAVRAVSGRHWTTAALDISSLGF